MPKYVLKKINDTMDPGKEIVSSDNITLEHIIPKKPLKEYSDALEKIGIDSAEEVFKLRNMTILGEEYNRKASNEPFENKIEMYKKSRLSINNRLKEFGHWGLDEIKAWGDFLLERSKEAWVLYEK